LPRLDVFPADVSGIVVNISGQPVQISGQHVFVGSGVFLASGQGGGTPAVMSGQNVIVESGLGVLISGQHVYVESGLHVVTVVSVDVSGAEFTAEISGKPVTISGDHVYVESGVFLASGQGGTPEIMSGQSVIVESGLGVLISGQHVFVESGVHVVATVSVESGLGVLISGQHVYVESGVFLASGQGGGTPAVMSGQSVIVESGLHVQISGQHVYVESGVHIVGTFTAAVSGKPVTISGDHVFIESGAHVVISSGLFVAGAGSTPAAMSGTYDATATEIKTGLLRHLTAGSGGEVLHSGNILATELKALTANTCDIYIGGVNDRPYSGFGYPLSPGEIKDIGINTFESIYLFPACSGDIVGWMGVV